MENLIKELDKAEKRAKTSRDKIYTSIDGLIAAVDRSKTEVDQLVGIFWTELTQHGNLHV